MYFYVFLYIIVLFVMNLNFRVASYVGIFVPFIFCKFTCLTIEITIWTLCINYKLINIKLKQNTL